MPIAGDKYMPSRKWICGRVTRTTDLAGARPDPLPNRLSELFSFTLIGGELKVVGELKFSFFAVLHGHFTQLARRCSQTMCNDYLFDECRI
jgi:hypothetical protein